MTPPCKRCLYGCNCESSGCDTSEGYRFTVSSLGRFKQEMSPFVDLSKPPSPRKWSFCHCRNGIGSKGLQASPNARGSCATDAPWMLMILRMTSVVASLKRLSRSSGCCVQSSTNLWYVTARNHHRQWPCNAKRPDDSNGPCAACGGPAIPTRLVAAALLSHTASCLLPRGRPRGSPTRSSRTPKTCIWKSRKTRSSASANPTGSSACFFIISPRSPRSGCSTSKLKSGSSASARVKRKVACRC